MQPEHETTLTQLCQYDFQKLNCKKTTELRATASKIVVPKPDLDTRAKKKILKHFLKIFLRRKIASAKMEKNTGFRTSTFRDALCLKKGYRTSVLSKTHFVRDSSGNSSTSTTCNSIYIAGTILKLQIKMEFCQPHWHEKQSKTHLQCGTDPTMVRDRSDHDPSMIWPHTLSSRNCRTAEVDHRRWGTHFVWKISGKKRGFVQLLSLKNAFPARLPSKISSATPPPAPLTIPFTMRKPS